MLGNIMQNWRVLLAGGVVVAIASGVGGFKIGHVFGFKSGYSDGKQAGLDAAAKDQLLAANKASKERLSNEKKFKDMPTDALDAYGIERGWVRVDQDR